jgi:hypothetical protein
VTESVTPCHYEQSRVLCLTELSPRHLIYFLKLGKLFLFASLCCILAFYIFFYKKTLKSGKKKPGQEGAGTKTESALLTLFVVLRASLKCTMSLAPVNS